MTDLTESNPTRVGLRYPEGILEPLASQRGLRYDPAPLGLEGAREAVAADLGRVRLRVDAESVALTASSSDAYGSLFKLLCDPGDAVLVPRPSYPLFEHLTRLEGVDPIPYPLEYHGRWEIDLAAVASRVTPRTRAILVVNPNNPTGSFVTAAEWEGVTDVCRARGLALIVDEVFGRYPMAAEPRGPSVLDRTSDVLTFVLGGLSKTVGLPQLKLGWIVLAGPADDVIRAREGLAFIADTYLPVGTPVQLAVSSLLDAGGAVTTQIAARIRTNHAALRSVVERHPAAQMLRIDGGWYAVVQVPAIRSEERLVLELLDRERVLVHPGYFFDFPREAFIVLSLLPEPSIFTDAAVRVVARAIASPDT